MADPLIQAALTGPVADALEWEGAVAPGAALAVPDPTGTFDPSLGRSSGGVDLGGFALRDRELRWRDQALAAALNLVADKFCAAFGVQLDRPTAIVPAEIMAANEQPATIPADATNLTVSISALPISRGSLVVSFGGNTTVDDGAGRFQFPDGGCWGTVDYVTGRVEVTTAVSSSSATALDFTWNVATYLASNSADLDPSQSTSAPGGWTGVNLVNNSSTPYGALLSDQHLYRRDLLLFYVLAVADGFFVTLRGGSDLVVNSISPATLGQAWSMAEGQNVEALPGFSDRWGPETWANGDRYLAWRDNVLARAIAAVSKAASFQYAESSDQGYFVSEDTGVFFRAEDDVTPADSAAPTSWPAGTLTSPPVRSFIPEVPVFEVVRSGSTEILETATKLSVAISDTDVNYLARNPVGADVIAALGDYGLASSNQTAVANMVNGWSPRAVVLIGDCNYPDGSPSTLAANNAVYSAYVMAGTALAAVGNHDYATGDAGTSLTAFLAFFNPPGARPYYRKTVGNYTEFFILHAGWNTNMAAAAVGTNYTSTLETDGITPDSVQGQWLKAALASSTALWKYVVVHFPPYTSATLTDNYYPGFPTLRWPFKQWGATGVFSAHVHGYERSLVDGLPYFVSGIGGQTNRQYTTPHIKGSIFRFEETEVSAYGALRIVSTAQFSRVESHQVSSVGSLSLVDEITFWADPSAAGYNLVPVLATVTPSLAESAYRVFRTGQIDYRWNAQDGVFSTEFVALAPENYVLATSDSRYTRWEAIGGSPALVYDRQLRTVEWVAPTPGLRNPAAESTYTFSLGRQSSLATLGGAVTPTFGQLASQATRLNPSPLRKVPLAGVVVPLLLPESGEFIDLAAVGGTATVDGAAFCKSGVSVALPGFDPRTMNLQPTTGGPARQWLRFGLRLAPAGTWYFSGASATSVSPGVTVSGAALVFPACAAGNYGSAPINEPYANWLADFQPGAYELVFEWQNQAVTDGSWNVTVRLNDIPVSSQVFAAGAGITALSAPIQLQLKSSSQVSLTFDSGPNLAPKVLRLRWRKLGRDAEQNYLVSVSFLGQPSVPSIEFEFESVRGQGGTVFTDWLDINRLPSATLQPLVKLVSGGTTPMLLTGWVVETALATRPGPADWAGKLAQLTKQLSGLVDEAWANRRATPFLVSGKFTPESVAPWLESFSCHDSTFGALFKSATAGDVGRLALLPASWPNQGDWTPVLRPLQDTALDWGFPVLGPQWDLLALPQGVVVQSVDPTGELAGTWQVDVQPGPANGELSLDFSAPVDSMYLPLI